MRPSPLQNNLLVNFCLLSAVFCARMLLVAPYPALVVVPVADLIAEPRVPYTRNEYRAMPYSHSMRSRLPSTYRIDQALFNTVVWVIKDEGEQLLIEHGPSFFISGSGGNQRQNYFWIEAASVLPLETLVQLGIPQAAIPEPIHYKKPTSLYSKNTVTLVKPWSDSSGRSFSVGTRFVVQKTQNVKGALCYCIYLFNPEKKLLEVVPIQADYCRLCDASPVPDKKDVDYRHQFITLIRSWITAGNDTQCIPYLLGGTTYIDRIPVSVTYKKVIFDHGRSAYFTIPGYEHSDKTGFDCAGLVLRAAQIVGIPYFYKNSSALDCLGIPRDPRSTQAVEPGDIMHIKGHILIVGSLDPATVIEARGYDHGFGKVQEIPLSAVFKNIKNYDDLVKVYQERKVLERLDSAGNVADTFATCKLYRLCSDSFPV